VLPVLWMISCSLHNKRDDASCVFHYIRFQPKFCSTKKTQTPLVRFVVESLQNLLYNKLCNESTASRTSRALSCPRVCCHARTDGGVDGAAEVERAGERPAGRLGTRPQRLARVAVLNHQRFHAGRQPGDVAGVT